MDFVEVKEEPLEIETPHCDNLNPLEMDIDLSDLVKVEITDDPLFRDLMVSSNSHKLMHCQSCT